MKTRKGINYKSESIEGTGIDTKIAVYCFCYISNSPRTKITVTSKSYDKILTEIRKIEKSDMFNPDQEIIVKIKPR